MTQSNVEFSIKQAEQFSQYMKSHRKYITLLERYQSSMNIDQEEKIRLTARRVGMELPEPVKPEEDQDIEKSRQ